MEILLQWTWCPAGQTCAPPAQPVPSTAAPALSGLGIAPARFRNRGRPPTGTGVRFNLSIPASVTFAVERSAAGRRLANGRCVVPTRGNRTRPRCTRTVVVGSFTRNGSAGANSFRFNGRVRGRLLAPGAYRLAAFASAGALRSATARRAFTVIAP
jgi:hypothetical protein